MYNFNYVIANYLRELNVSDSNILHITRNIETHEEPHSLRSLTDVFDTWQIENNAVEISPADLDEVETPFLAHTKDYEEHFVLVKKIADGKVLYINGLANTIQEDIDVFITRFDGIVFKAEIADPALLKAPAQLPKKIRHATLRQIRRISDNQDEQIVYRFFRKLSVFTSYFFIRMGIGPNLITLIWLLMLLAAAFLFSLNQYRYDLLAAGLMIFHFILDCSDGEVARITKRTSRVGTIFEQMVHWITNLALVMGITFGLHRNTGNADIFIPGFICIIGDASYLFSLYQLDSWINKYIHYGFLHRYLKLLSYVSPPNHIIFITTAIAHQLYAGLLVWMTISLLTFLVVCFFFLRREFILRAKYR
jgi:phosphatidylglycerophosphate synthase